MCHEQGKTAPVRGQHIIHEPPHGPISRRQLTGAGEHRKRSAPAPGRHRSQRRRQDHLGPTAKAAETTPETVLQRRLRRRRPRKRQRPAAPGKSPRVDTAIEQDDGKTELRESTYSGKSRPTSYAGRQRQVTPSKRCLSAPNATRSTWTGSPNESRPDTTSLPLRSCVEILRLACRGAPQVVPGPGACIGWESDQPSWHTPSLHV